MLGEVGTVTYFDRPFREKYYILNPDWLTTGAYEIILSDITRQKRGRINAQDVETILSRIDTFQYTAADHGFLMDLMDEFDLCHQYSTREWLIPSALEGQSKTDLVEFTQQNHRQYALFYPVSLPRSVIHRFIARNVQYAHGSDYWRNGIVVKHPDSTTLMYVEADDRAREIRLYIHGERVRDCWEFFRKDFREFSQGFEYEENIKEGGNKISYNHLIKMHNKGIREWYSPDLDREINVQETLGMFEATENTPRTPTPRPVSSPKTDNQIPEIFFSYAWGDKDEVGTSREDIVVKLYEELKKEGYAVKRDKTDLGYKGLISAFMKDIGRGNFVVVALSDKYLRSEYCMYELYEVFRNSKFDVSIFLDRTYPIRVENLDLSKMKIKEYQNYWNSEQKEWKELVALDPEYGTEAVRIKDIHGNLAKLLKMLKDINTLTQDILSQDNFAEIKKAIENRTRA